MSLLAKLARWGITALLRVYNTLIHGTSRYFGVVSIETITACSMKCAYCPRTGHTDIRSPKMDLAMIYNILHSLRRNLYIGGILWGGYCEPSLNLDLPNLCAAAKRILPLCWQTIYTNGENLDVLEHCAPYLYRIVLSTHGRNDRIEHVKNICAKHSVRFTLNVIDDNHGHKTNRAGQVFMQGYRDYSPMLPHCRKYGLNAVSILTDGTVVWCCSDYRGLAPVYHIRSDETTIDWGYIWAQIKVREKALFSARCPGLCSNCMQTGIETCVY